MKFGTLAIIGRPNVGKSTLINALVKEKVAIVSDKPQTTRTRILGVAHFPDAQLAVLDTPGIHQPKHRLNSHMVQTTMDVLQEADIVYVMVDPSNGQRDRDRYVLDTLENVSPRRPFRGVFLLLNKIDRIHKPKLLPVIEAFRTWRPWTEIVPISALTGENLDRLITLTLAQLPDEGMAYYEPDFLTDQPVRHLAAEIIREKVLALTREELPYVVAVKVDEFHEHEEASRARISATIFVERPTQKAIVIGKSGSRLKAIGTQARRDMERQFGMNIFLTLWVKVQEGWRDNDRLLGELGYQ